MKRLFFSSLALLILVLIFLGAYNFAFKNNPNDPKVSGQEGEEEQHTPETTGPVATAVENPINEVLLGFTLSPNNTVSYYSVDDKAFKKASPEGKDKEVLLSNLPGTAERVVWAPKRDKALVLLRLANGSAAWHLADFPPKTLVALKPEITRVSWNNLGDKIFYLYTNPSNQERSLNIANPDGSEWKELARLGKRDFYLASIPQSSSASYWTRPHALEETTFGSVTAEGTDRKELFKGKFGADYLWSPDGEWVLVSSSSEKGGTELQMSLINKNGGELRSLNIPSLVSKAVWSKDSHFLYYALPGGLKGATLPNDYFEKPLASQDTFWKVDIETGKTTRLLELKELGQGFDSMDLQLSPSEDALYFTDRQTKRVHRIDL